MKAIAVLLVLALAAFANADEAVMGQEVAAVEQVGAEAVEMQTEVDAAADEDEAVVEDEAEDEAEAEDEDEVEAEEEDEALEEAEDESEEESEDEAEAEADEEEEFSLIEAEAEADEERRKSQPKKKRAKIVRAPKPLKNKPFKFHSERIVASSTKPEDPELAKLDLALAAVKEDILSTNKQINDERRWVIAVSKIIKSYNTKMQRVEAHIIALRKEMKMLYRKKKQIENLKLQRALQAKLKEAKAELKTLTESLKHVARKQGQLNNSGKSLRQTIAGIQGQLAKLRGQHMFKKCKPGFKYNRKAKKCRSICRSGKKFNRKTKKCVSRCSKGKKYNKKTRKCVAAKKGRKARKGKGKKASRK